MLPNLDLQSSHGGGATQRYGDWPDGLSLGSDEMAITGQRDPRVDEILRYQPEAKRLLRGFRDGGGRQYLPAVLIVRRTASDRIRTNLEACTSFRNAVCFTFLLRARAAAAASHVHVSPSWTDTFAFHPAVITSTGRLASISDAQRVGYSASTRFRAGPSPSVPLAGEPLYPDRLLHELLGKAWRERFGNRRKALPFLRRLFRSLEVATIAGALADTNRGSLPDYGASVALWVSATEILSWPANGRANHGAVHELLSQFHWPHPVLAARRYRVRIWNKTYSANTAQKTYALLYHARNCFLHGEPVTASVLTPVVGSRKIDLPALAPVIYRSALVAYLRQRFPTSSTSDPWDVLAHMDYCNALSRAYHGREWDD